MTKNACINSWRDTESGTINEIFNTICISNHSDINVKREQQFSVTRIGVHLLFRLNCNGLDILEKILNVDETIWLKNERKAILERVRTIKILI